MWDEAFLAQARSDWEIFGLLHRMNECERCHCLHYLQMTTEKLAKALAAKAMRGQSVGHSHHVFVKMLQSSKRSPTSFASLLRMSNTDYRAMVDSLLPLAHSIQSLVPSVGSSGGTPDHFVNVEYPWITPDGTVVAPANHDFSVTDELRDARGRRLLSLLDKILSNYEAI